MKSSGGNVGARKLFDLCKRMEELGKKHTEEGREDLLLQLQQEFEMVKFVLEQESRKGAA
jgi:HPt (histidine-containing phosphotransfer) domain-containing protein